MRSQRRWRARGRPGLGGWGKLTGRGSTGRGSTGRGSTGRGSTGRGSTGRGSTGRGSTGRVGSGSEEALEDVRQLVRRNAGAVVADLDGDATAGGGRGDYARGVSGGVHKHVYQQVVDGAAQQFFVADRG